MTERYRHVYQRGYDAAAEDATRALIRFLQEGGQIAVMPFGDRLAVKHGNGLVAEAGSVLALLRYGEGRRGR